MKLFDDLKKQRENWETLRRKRELLEALWNWHITKAQYDFEMENLKLSAEEREYEKNKITPGKIATKAATWTVKILVNSMLWDFSPFWWKKTKK